MTPVRVRIPGLACDGEWLAAAHSHFATNRLNKPPVTLYYDEFDMLYALAAMRLCKLTRAMYPATNPGTFLSADWLHAIAGGEYTPTMVP